MFCNAERKDNIIFFLIDDCFFLYLWDACDKYFIGSIDISFRFHMSRNNMMCLFISKSYLKLTSLNFNQIQVFITEIMMLMLKSSENPY